VYVSVKNNFNHLDDMGEFYRRLLDLKMIRLTDAKGIENIDPHLLPNHISKLQNDPFRSLAASLKYYKCFQDTGSIPFMEFFWADFFREQYSDTILAHQLMQPRNKKYCSIRPFDEQCIKDETQLLISLIPGALQACSSPRASHLPGYIPASKK
jgi:hypothetical protein